MISIIIRILMMLNIRMIIIVKMNMIISLSRIAFCRCCCVLTGSRCGDDGLKDEGDWRCDSACINISITRCYW